MILRNIEDLRRLKADFAITIGTFDGVHLGHKKILSTLKSQAREDGLSTLVITFTNHPKEIITGEKVIPIITSDEKLEHIEEEGIDVVVALPFTDDIRRKTQREFLDYLGVSIKKLIVGYDFTFGYKGETYEEDSLPTIKVEALYLNGSIVSSTIIREFMTSGEMEKLREFLGRPYRHSGQVIHGKKMGKFLGYPTTNVTINDSVYALRSGVYVTRTYLIDEVFESVTNVGRIPTFTGRPFSVETYIFDFNRSIYGQEVRLEFLHYLRDEKKYENLEDLVKQIKKDVEDTKIYFLKHPQERV
ncbi:MAG: bifunctional riboflavin kinase/FAD synthetase [Tissierellia bacterium]|nr:bifunctional riboflavin kinase/FAD synthetase [Tissierellia bacterium]